jgi:AraC family transcriptional regulator of adaptative response / DNA-3-methyladenine glycosylase II
MPGAWDPFELTVRAILGQQISVRAATTIAGRIASLFGSPLADDAGLTRLFPTPPQLARAPLERAGVMPARADTIRMLGQRVEAGTIAWTGPAAPQTLRAALTSIRGIGEWTAHYVAMRALGDPDAFPSGDLILRRAAGDCTVAALERTSTAWRPWRAYAVMLLWQGAIDDATAKVPRAASAADAVRAAVAQETKAPSNGKTVL